jgi:hypothetical protein
MNTPWGYADHIDTFNGVYNGQKVEIADLIQVSTPSHGGIGIEIKVGDEVLSDYAKKTAINDGKYYWFEEDCDWAIVILEFNKAAPNVLDSKIIETAKSTADSWHPDYDYN